MLMPDETEVRQLLKTKVLKYSDIILLTIL